MRVRCILDSHRGVRAKKSRCEEKFLLAGRFDRVKIKIKNKTVRTEYYYITHLTRSGGAATMSVAGDPPGPNGIKFPETGIQFQRTTLNNKYTEIYEHSIRCREK